MQLSPRALEIERQEREANHARLMQIVEERRAQQQRKLSAWNVPPAPSSKLKRGTGIKSRRPATTLTHDGQTLTIREWGERLGAEPRSIRNRLTLGWSTEKALTMPFGKTGRPRKSQVVAQVERPGVSSIFQGFTGTGAGSTLQATPNIVFQKDNE